MTFLEALKKQEIDFLGNVDTEIALLSWVPGSNPWVYLLPMNEAGFRITGFSWVISCIVTILTHRRKSFSMGLCSKALWALINTH